MRRFYINTYCITGMQKFTKSCLKRISSYQGWLRRHREEPVLLGVKLFYLIVMARMVDATKFGGVEVKLRFKM